MTNVHNAPQCVYKIFKKVTSFLFVYSLLQTWIIHAFDENSIYFDIHVGGALVPSNFIRYDEYRKAEQTQPKAENTAVIDEFYNNQPSGDMREALENMRKAIEKDDLLNTIAVVKTKLSMYANIGAYYAISEDIAIGLCYTQIFNSLYDIYVRSDQISNSTTSKIYKALNQSIKSLALGGKFRVMALENIEVYAFGGLGYSWKTDTIELDSSTMLKSSLKEYLNKTKSGITYNIGLVSQFQINDHISINVGYDYHEYGSFSDVVSNGKFSYQYQKPLTFHSIFCGLGIVF